MKTKDFFRLMLKLFGLYSLIIALFNILPQTFGYVVSFSPEYIDWLSIVWVVAVAGALLSLFFFLTFQPDWLISKLKLDKGFDEDTIPFSKLNGTAILKIGCIVVGGIIFLDNLPSFLTGCFFTFKQSVQQSVEGMFETNVSMSSKVNLATSLLNLIIGYLLINNYEWISRMLLPKAKAENPDHTS